MIDTVAITQAVDLRGLVEKDTEYNHGKRLWCPFCQGGQKTGNHAPALAADERRYYCFGCGVGGDVIDYIMRRDNIGFVQACQALGWQGSTDRETLSRLQAERKAAFEAEQKQRAAELDALLSEYSTQEIWEAYHRRMTASHFAWWESQGVPRDWQDYLRLGFTPDKIYLDSEGALRHSAAYTIPFFHYGFKFVNLQYRLSDPSNAHDRYRFESKLKTTYYMTTPNLPIGEQVVICEGAKKGMVCRIFGGIGDDVTVLAVPSKVDFGGIGEAVKECGQAWIILDPDAWDKPKNAPQDWTPPPVRLARQVGREARIISLPVKLDDLILQVQPEPSWMATLMRTARKAHE